MGSAMRRLCLALVVATFAAAPVCASNFGTTTANQGTPNAGGVNAWPVAPEALHSTNLSGTILTGGSLQQISPVTLTRQSFDFINKSGNGDLCQILFVDGVTTGTIPVPDGWEYIRTGIAVPNNAIQVTCTTTSDAFYAAVQ